MPTPEMLEKARADAAYDFADDIISWAGENPLDATAVAYLATRIREFAQSAVRDAVRSLILSGLQKRQTWHCVNAPTRPAKSGSTA